MTQKDYEAIARAIHRVRDADTTPARLWAIESTARAIAQVMQADNPKFDRARFLQARGF